MVQLCIFSLAALELVELLSNPTYLKVHTLLIRSNYKLQLLIHLSLLNVLWTDRYLALGIRMLTLELPHRSAQPNMHVSLHVISALFVRKVLFYRVIFSRQEHLTMKSFQSLFLKRKVWQPATYLVMFHIYFKCFMARAMFVMRFLNLQWLCINAVT